MKINLCRSGYPTMKTAHSRILLQSFLNYLKATEDKDRAPVLTQDVVPPIRTEQVANVGDVSAGICQTLADCRQLVIHVHLHIQSYPYRFVFTHITSVFRHGWIPAWIAHWRLHAVFGNPQNTLDNWCHWWDIYTLVPLTATLHSDQGGNVYHEKSRRMFAINVIVCLCVKTWTMTATSTCQP